MTREEQRQKWLEDERDRNRQLVKENQEAAQRIRALESERKKLLEAAKEREAEEEAVAEMKANMATIDVPRWAVKGAAPKSGPGVPLLEICDWHDGESVRRHLVNGRNEYNKVIMEARVQRLAQGTLDLTLHHMVKPSYPGIIVISNGDMVTGSIHEELLATNWADTVTAIRHCAAQQSKLLEVLADNFEYVWMIAVSGNHGRFTKKMQFKRRVGENADTLVASHVLEHFANRRNVRVDIAPGAQALFEVWGHRYLVAHLDPASTGAKGGDGIIGAAGPIIRSYVRLSARARRLGQEFDTLVGAHYHLNFGVEDRIIVGSSLKGFDEMCMCLGYDYAPPSQRLWFHHPERGITAWWPVKVDPKDAHPRGEWLRVFDTEAA